MQPAHRLPQASTRILMREPWVIGVDSVWLIAILLILVFSAYLRLNDSVLIMLLGTTTANVLGLALIVLKGLFGKSNTTKTSL